MKTTTEKHVALIAAIIFPLAASLLGSYFTSISVTTWFTTLEKPFFMPSSWIFGAVWPILYFLMGYALYLMLITPAEKKDHYLALQFFFLQLVINTGWCLVFFALLDPFSAMIGIVSLLFLLTGTVVAFYKINKLSAYLLIPYWVWILFATLLNAGIIYVNV
jgi:translocator protein